MSNRPPLFPPGYEPPEPDSDLLKLRPGKTTVRIVTPFLAGFEVWRDDRDEEGQQVRVCWRQESPEMPPNKVGWNNERNENERTIPFLACVVWNHSAARLQLWTISQATIRERLWDLANSRWGDLRDYDIEITRIGSGRNNTEYKVLNLPPCPLPESAKKAIATYKIDMTRMYGEHRKPFEAVATPVRQLGNHHEGGSSTPHLHERRIEIVDINNTGRTCKLGGVAGPLIVATDSEGLKYGATSTAVTSALAAFTALPAFAAVKFRVMPNGNYALEHVVACDPPPSRVLEQARQQQQDEDVSFDAAPADAPDQSATPGAAPEKPPYQMDDDDIPF